MTCSDSCSRIKASSLGTSSNSPAEIRKGSRLLKQMLSTNPPGHVAGGSHQGGRARVRRRTRGIIDRLNRPSSPRSTVRTSTRWRALDDVMDAIDAAAAVFRLYKIQRCGAAPAGWRTSSAKRSTASPRRIGALEKRKGVLELAASDSQLEHEADRIHREAIAELFDQETRPHRGHQVEGDLRPPRGGHRPLRGRRQRARRHRSSSTARPAWTRRCWPSWR